MPSRLPSPAPLENALLDAAAALPAAPVTCLIALSGGLDSLVLLDALARLTAAGRLPAIAKLVAAHVHHGLSDNADAWLAHCDDACRQRGVAFVSRKVKVVNQPQVSLEEAARQARRTALREMAEAVNATHLIFAHHQDDQAETLLLQLLRGAGPRGLSAMATLQSSPSCAIWRPLLSLPRSALLAYAQARELTWVEDESNADLGFRRNFLRHRVMPVLAEAFPAYRKTFARAARLQAEAVALLGEAVPDSIAFPLSLADFKTLSEEAARLQLRHALIDAGLRAPAFAATCEMVRQLQNARADARISLNHGDHRIGIFAGQIHCYQPTPAYRVRWQGETEIDLPHGRIRCVRGIEPGLRVDPQRDCVWIASRQSAHESIKRALRPTRALGDLLREARLPQWERDPYPRIYINDQLAALPNLGVAERFAASEGGVTFLFEPRP